MDRNLLELLKMNDVEYKENLRLKNYSSVKIGGVASLVIFPDTIPKLITALDFLQENKIDYKILGRLTNVLISDEQITSVLIKTDKLKGIMRLDSKIRLYSGERMSSVAISLAREGIGDFSALSGIPGSIGGMIRSNAGAHGMEIADLIDSVTAYSPNGRDIVKLDRSDLGFGYRTSVFSYQPLVILYADFRVTSDSPSVLFEKISAAKEKRQASQPLDFPSLGSVFKRPPLDYAARLIDEAGLKGCYVGDAMVSEKHAGFIINRGNATFYDFISLIEYVKRVVNEKYGILLEEEIEIYKGK